MLAALLGKKVGMTQVYDAKGVVHPVTIVQAGPCCVMQVKSVKTDGYDAVQIGFDDLRVKLAKKPQIGRAAKVNTKPKRVTREIRLLTPAEGIEAGQTVTVADFEGVTFVDVLGTSKGKGFQGVMKRHHFTGLGASHGTERKHRSPGSIGAHATNRGWGGDIKRGKRMAGHMGDAHRTVKNSTLVSIDTENNLLLIKGSVPGANGGFVFIRKAKTARLRQPAAK
jgi:large subunit ribosomal protein L3